MKPFSGYLWLSALWLISFSLFATGADTPSATEIKVIKPASDVRDIGYYQLPNKLKVLLISDPEVEKSAASMDVKVGSTDDPMDRQGLAHFLEHMLFLGTDKYPKADEYQDFISGHGGNHNAFTSATHTNYFFDIEHASLEPALDRFAQFFIAPKFDATYVERERKAVNSEYTAKYTDEYRRIRDVYREIAVDGHPVNHFSVGNLQTLDVDQPRDLRADLIRFYQSHYSADRMGLTVISNRPLADMRAWVVEKFSAITLRKLAPLPEFGSFLDAQSLSKDVSILPRKEMRELSFVFPVPASEQYFEQKPLSYIGFFIGHEGEGSLLSLLKSQNWATALGAGNSFDWRGGEAFSVTINLTDAGLKNIHAIEALLFAYIDLLREQGVEKWRFLELQKLGNLAFEYGDKKDPVSEVVDLSNSLHYYPPQWVLKAPNLYAKFDKNLINRFLGYLQPKNMLRVLVAPDVNKDRQSSYYETPYSVSADQKVGRNLPDAQLPLLEQLALPEKNAFIASDFSLAVAKSATPEKPVVVRDKRNTRIWYAPDNRFAIPKGHVKARLLLPDVASSVTGAATARLYASVVKEMLNETAYNAAMAGLGFDISASSRGLDLSFSGYNDTLDSLVLEVVTSLRAYNSSAKKRLEVNDRVFADSRNELLRQYNNMSMDSPYRKLMKQLPAMVFSPYWTPEVLAETLTQTDRAQYDEASAVLFDDARLEVLVYGNYDKKSAIKIGKRLEKLVSGKKAARDVDPNKVVKLAGGAENFWLSLPVEHADAGVVYYVQGLDDLLVTNAKMQVLQQLVSTPFYATLRTEKQLGYIVFTSSYSIREVPALIAVVQSPVASVPTLLSEVETFFKAHKNAVFSNFERDKSAVISVLSEQAKSQNEQASDFWEAILTGDETFDRRARLLAAVQGLTMDQMVAFYQQQMLSPGNALVITTPPESKGAMGENYTRIEDVRKFKAEANTYVYP